MTLSINFKSPWEQPKNPNRQATFKNNERINTIINLAKKAQKSNGFKPGGNGGNNGGGGNNGNPFNDFNFSKKFIVTILFGIGLLWLASGFYTLKEDEQSVVMQFGEFVRTGTPGPNYHLPYPIETMQKFVVTRVQREEIGFRSTGSGRYLSDMVSAKNVTEESLMLTGDENILDINFVVQWKIKNLENFVFKISNPYATVKYAAESSMREIIGQTSLVDAQTNKRTFVEESVKKLLQETMDQYQSGIEIVGLQMLKVDPPSEVVDAFRDVQTARADKERLINEAMAYRNDILPRARGLAAKVMEEAQAYKESVIAKSQGETARYESVLSEYKHSKDVTQRRIYLDTLKEVMSNIDKIIVDDKASNSLVPYLPLNQLGKK